MRIRFNPSLIMGPTHYEYKPNSLFGFLMCVRFARFWEGDVYADNFEMARESNTSCSAE